jgi:glycosyltransferase involved in cell wall biosynthesis
MADYLPECLESVLMQSLKDIELLCVNDGSTDDSADTVKKFSEDDDRVILINKENSGAASAKNKGLESSRGEYICFMDPDDMYPDKDVLQDLYHAAKENNVKICGGSFSLFNNETKEQTTSFENTLWGYSFSEDKLWDYSDYQFDYGYKRFIYSKEMIQDKSIFFPNYLRFEDPPFLVRAMLSSGQFYSLKRFTYLYRTIHKRIEFGETKIVSILNGIADNLTISNELGLNDLHTLTLSRFTGFFTYIAHELEKSSSPEIVNLLFRISNIVDENMVSLSRYSNVDVKAPQNCIAEAFRRRDENYKTLKQKYEETNNAYNDIKSLKRHLTHYIDNIIHRK